MTPPTSLTARMAHTILRAMDTELRVILLLPEGPRELTFADGRILLPRERVTIEVVGPELLEIQQGGTYVVDGEGGRRGRSRIGPGSIVSIGAAYAIVLPWDDPYARPKFWKKLFVRWAQHEPALLFQLADLDERALTRGVLEAARHVSLADATLHAAKFAALIHHGLYERDRTAPGDAVAAAAGKESLLDPNVAAIVARERQYFRERQQDGADARAARAARNAPERDAGAAEPTVAWDLVDSAEDAGHGWFRGESCLPPEQRPRCGDGRLLTHLCTVLVPREYRTQSAKLVALALFQAPAGCGELSRLVHPHEYRFEEHIGAFAVVWLTAEELRRGPRGAGHRWVALRARVDDPNAGEVTNSGEYRRAADDFTATYARNHFGGTTESRSIKIAPRYLYIDGRDVGGDFAGAHLELIRDRPRIVWGAD